MLALAVVSGAALGPIAAPAHAVPSARTAVVAQAPGVTASPAASAAPAARVTPAVTAPPTSTATPIPTPTPSRAPQPVGRALAVDVVESPVLTLPAKDGLRDSTRIRVRSGTKGAVDVLAVSGKKVVHLGDAVTLAKARTGFARSVRVPVSALKPGGWSIRVRRADDRTIRARVVPALLVGTGTPVHVLLRPAARTLRPWRDGVLDAAVAAVTATDETGTAIPIRGTVRLQAGPKHRIRPLDAAGGVEIPATGLPLGRASLTAEVTGPAGKAVTRTAPLTLAPTGVGRLRIARSSDTVQPVVDGLLDSVLLSTSGAAVADSPAAVSGSLTLALGATVVKRFAVRDGTARTFGWDGRTDGVIVPGTYTATLSLRGPDGPARTKATTLLVTKEHLPHRVQDLFAVAAGNQQGLAVHDGVFYVGFDNGDGSGRIEKYDGRGAPVGTIGPLAIGHAAELSYSTTTGLLYAANGGGGNRTMVWSIDPSTGAIRDTFDLTGLGNNGMVAVDDAGRRLLVFAGTAGNYSVTPVALTQTTVTDLNGVTTSAPQVGTAAPITVTGVPQGIELVGQQLWVYTSLKRINHLAKYDLAAVSTPSAESDLMNEGEGEGLAIDLPTGSIYVGTHSANRVGRLLPVADE